MTTGNEIHRSDDKSEVEMLSEILKLLLKLLLKCIIKLVRLMARGCIGIFSLLKLLLQACVDFWNDNSTQQKLHIAKEWCKAALITLGKWTLIALKALGVGLVWTIRTIILGLINLRPTLVLTGKFLAKCGRAVWKFLRFLGAKCAQFFRRRRLAYLAFRRNKGLKGLMIDVKNYLQLTLNDYMDEEQNEPDKNTLSYEEYMRAEHGGDGHSDTIGKKIYNGMKNIIDGD